MLLVEAAEKKNNSGRAGKELKILGSHPDGEEVKITLEESIDLIESKRKIISKSLEHNSKKIFAITSIDPNDR